MIEKIDSSFSVKVVLLIIFLCSINNYYAQNEKEEQTTFKFGGYINWTAIYDSRQTVSLREGQFLLYPANPLKDKNGNDINAKSNFNILSLQSRVNVKVAGPGSLGAKTFGFIEAEFFGTSDGDANGVRLRHAYIGFQWNSFSLVAGQYWHPLFITEAYPQVISFNTGAPFLPFSRNPQIRFTQSFNNVDVIATLYSQRDFTSTGPAGFSSAYIRNSAMPAMNLRLQMKAELFFLGGGIDYKVLVPRLETSKNIITDKKIKSFAGTLYLKYSDKLFTFMTQGCYGQNMTDLLMLGGYAVSGIDTVKDYEDYTNVDACSIWADLFYGKNIEIGIFSGYTKNLGSDNKIVGKIYSRVDNIGYLFRISPRVMFNVGRLKIGTELEFTRATFDKPDNFGKIDDGEVIDNIRFLIGAFYNF